MEDINTLIQHIREEIEQMKFYIQNDGGDVNFLSFKDGILTLEVTGHCIGCSSFDSTYTFGIKEALMQAHPEDIKDILFKIGTQEIPQAIKKPIKLD